VQRTEGSQEQYLAVAKTFELAKEEIRQRYKRKAEDHSDSNGVDQISRKRGIPPPHPGQNPWVEYGVFRRRRRPRETWQYVSFPLGECLSRTEISGVVQCQPEIVRRVQSDNRNYVQY